MADNVAITAGSGTSIATDDISSVHYQRVKLVVGAEGVAVGDTSGRTVDGGAGAAQFVDQRSKKVRLSATPTVSTTPAYTAKDAVGTLLTFASAVRASGGSGCVTRVQVADRSQQMADLELVLFDRSITAATDNSPFDPTDAETLLVVGRIPIGGGFYSDFNDNSVADVECAVDFVANGTDLYGQLVTRSTPTYVATTDIVVIITVVQD